MRTEVDQGEGHGHSSRREGLGEGEAWQQHKQPQRAGKSASKNAGGFNKQQTASKHNQNRLWLEAQQKGAVKSP
jgi:hypothetical protein